MKYKILLASLLGILFISCNKEGEETGLLVKCVKAYHFYTGSDSTAYTAELKKTVFYNSTRDTVYYRYYSVDVKTQQDLDITKTKYDAKFQAYINDSMKVWSDTLTYTDKIIDNGTYESVVPSADLLDLYHVPLEKLLQ